MSGWKLVGVKASDKLVRLHHFAIIKRQPEGDEECISTRIQTSRQTRTRLRSHRVDGAPASRSHSSNASSPSTDFPMKVTQQGTERKEAPPTDAIRGERRTEQWVGTAFVVAKK